MNNNSEKVREDGAELENLLNEFADEFAAHHSSFIISEIKFYNGTFKDYMKKENSFEDFLRNIVDHNLVKLANVLGYDIKSMIASEIQGEIKSEIKRDLYTLIEIRVSEEIQNEINSLQESILDRENESYIQKTQKLIDNLQRSLID